MSEKGLVGKKREREVESLPTDDDDKASVLFSMPDVVHRYVSPYLTQWSDHRALACTTPGLWRYYRQHDESTRVMFLFYRVVSPTSQKIHERYIRESGDARCVLWLWEKRKRTHRTHNLARDFCLCAARSGSIELVELFFSFLEPIEKPVARRRIFETLCKYGRDKAAMAIISNLAEERDFLQFSITLAGYVHKVPNAFQFVLKLVEGGGDKDAFLAMCLFNSCVIPSGYDIEAFEWLWNYCINVAGKTAQWCMERILDDLAVDIEDGFFSKYTAVLGRLPVIFRRFLAEFCPKPTSGSEGGIVWNLREQVILHVSEPKDDDDEVTVNCVFLRPNLRLSRTLKIPKACI